MRKSIFMLTAVLAVVLFSCKESPYINEPGKGGKIDSVIPILIPDTDGIIVSVAEAYEIGLKQMNDVSTVEKYKISATIASIETNLNDIPGKYTNINFYISDGGSKSLKCQYTKNINNLPFRSKTEVPAVGSKVTVVGPLSKYNGSPQMKEGFILRIDEVPAQAQ